MSEQFLRAWAVDESVLRASLGSKDAKLLARTKKSELAEELEELFDDDGDEPLAEQITALVMGKKPIGSTWSTLRCLSLLADVVGARVDDEITLPGRGWQDLGPAWKHWELAEVAKLWTRAPAWSKKYGDWPWLMLAPAAELPALGAELRAFKPSSIAERKVPKKVARFGDGGWEIPDLIEVVEELRGELLRCVGAAARKKKDLLLVLDGSQ